MTPIPYFKVDFPEIWEQEEIPLENGAFCQDVGVPTEQTLINKINEEKSNEIL